MQTHQTNQRGQVSKIKFESVFPKTGLELCLLLLIAFRVIGVFRGFALFAVLFGHSSFILHPFLAATCA